MRHAALLALVALGGCTGSQPGATCAGPDACDTSDQCPSLQICVDCACASDPGAGSCVTTAGCPLGTSCRAGTCVRTSCRTADDCQSGEDCDPTHHSCVASDCTTKPCPEGLTCDEARSPPACVACRSSADCGGSTPVCGPDGTCAACAADRDCGPDLPVCSRSRVCGVCRQDQDCKVGQRCSDAGACGSCGSDADCPMSRCTNGTCESGPADGDPCGSGGSCGPGLRCTPESVCRPRCDPTSRTCATGRVCALFRPDGKVVVEDGKPAAACVPVTGGNVAGQLCDPTMPCEQDLECLLQRPGSGICSSVCDPAGAPCDSPLSCLTFPIGASGDDLSLCSRPSTYLSPCVSDSDCDTLQACQPTDQGGSLSTRCDFGAGAGPAQACTGGSQCRSNLCLELGDGGMCFGGCRSDADCPDGFCSPMDVKVGSETATFSACHPACTSDADCVGRGGTCGVTVHQGKLVGECLPVVGKVPAGAACKADPECRSGTCLLPAHLCAGACARDLDCAGSAVCRTALVSLAPGDEAQGPLCWGPACQRAADCEAMYTCALEPDSASPLHALRQSCLGPVGANRVGQPCLAAADCQSGMCFGPFPGDHSIQLEDCTNKLDDDGDGLVDCQDPDCIGTADCGPGGEICKDKNADGLSNCLDPACRRTAACPEICEGGTDEDGDHLVDCADPSCAYTASCQSLNQKGCFGVCVSDFDCAEGTVCQELKVQTPGNDSVVVRGCVPP